jgi:hypothetical protein
MRDMPDASRIDFLRERLRAIQSALDADYADRCRAIEAAMSMISEPYRARA